MSSSLRTYIRQVLMETDAKPTKRKLRVFDFDDTLVKTKSKITVTSKFGDSFDLTPGEYAVYEPMPGDQFDFTDFTKLIDPQIIKWTANILRNLVAAGRDVVILTARESSEPVAQFIKEIGLPPIEIIALGDSNPLKKSEYIAKRIEEDNLDEVEFFDDSVKNIKAVMDLKPKYPNTKIILRHVVEK